MDKFLSEVQATFDVEETATHYVLDLNSANTDEMYYIYRRTDVDRKAHHSLDFEVTRAMQRFNNDVYNSRINNKKGVFGSMYYDIPDHIKPLHLKGEVVDTPG